MHVSAVADGWIEAGDPCDGKTTHVAYITVSQPGADHGPNTIGPGENLNPVKTLRMGYDAWRKAQPASFQ